MILRQLITGTRVSAVVAAFALGVVPLSVAAPAQAAPTFSPGAPGHGDPYFPLQGNGGYDAQTYDLRMSYQPDSNDLVATATIAATATQNLSRFDLDLHDLTVEKVTVNGAAARFATSGDELVVTPSAGLPKGRSFTVVVRYDGRPKHVLDPDGSKDGWIRTEDGVFNANEPQGAMTWYPGNHHPTDKALYRFTVDVPQKYSVVANGDLLSQATVGGRTTYVWQGRETMASYLATVSIGDFELRTSHTGSGLLNIVAVDPYWAKEATGFDARIGPILDFFSGIFGAYPYSSTGGIIDHAPNVGYALECQNRPIYPRVPGELTLSHELAHQWYGDSVTPTKWQDIWLNEGFATYLEWMWGEHIGRNTVQGFFDQAYAVPADDEFWQVPTADPGGPANLFHNAVYDRGAMTLHLLRKTVGDATFFDIMKRWHTEHRYGNASTADFIALSEQLSGRQLDDFFQAWLYDKGKPAI